MDLQLTNQIPGLLYPTIPYNTLQYLQYLHYHYSCNKYINIIIMNLFLSLPPSPALVSIQLIHGVKVSIAHSDYDDGHWQPRRFNDGQLCVVHVRDSTIRQHQQDEVLLTGKHKKILKIENKLY